MASANYEALQGSALPSLAQLEDRNRHDRGEDGGLRTFILGGVAVAMTGLLLFSRYGTGVGSEKEAESEKLKLDKIEAVTLDCRVRASGSGVSRAKLSPTLAGKSVGIHTTAKTIGRVNTLTCVDATDVRDEIDDNGVHTIRIPASSIRLFNEIDESATRTVPEDNAPAKFLKGAVKTVEGVTGSDFGKGIDAVYADLVAISRANLVNHVQGACGSAAWDITKEVASTAYKDIGESKGIPRDKVNVIVEPNPSRPDGKPDFSGPYVIPRDYETSISDKKKGNSAGCEIAPDAGKADIRPMPDKSNTADSVDKSHL